MSCSRPIASASTAKPKKSSRVADSVSLSFRKAVMPMNAAMPIGTLIKNTERRVPDR